ncbi:hypothetical protein SAY87_007521 [Trapa incisa]|uniref:Uncharacterized protein n=1 Tax=Trapa incisa TaxID=236973 RepID=A0AAN7KEK5_9MYRT|nr:hypothetical protein SAY87_007521 [Trapa incisa]
METLVLVAVADHLHDESAPGGYDNGMVKLVIKEIKKSFTVLLMEMVDDYRGITLKNSSLEDLDKPY